MPVPKKRWLVASRIPEECAVALAHYHPVLRQLLYNRGYCSAEEARAYLEARPPDGIEPSKLLGMQAAVDRIRFAIDQNEAVAVYGDYDADGVTATALLVQALRLLGADVIPYIPNRFDEGYGLNKEALTSLQTQGIRLVITVDCGIRSPEEAEHARNLSLDLIITDHHHPDAHLPQAVALINPKQPGDAYPDKDLAGVGLAYKLVCGLLEHAENKPFAAESFLDLVALGTVADMAPLTGENRMLVRGGLEYLRRPARQGVRSLIGAAGLYPDRINAGHIGYMLGPRLNAAGRLDSALAALNLLLTSDVQEAGRLAQQLNQQNTERQELTRRIQQLAEQRAFERDPQTKLLFAADPSFNPGVVGLAASRLVEAYYRPAIVAFQGEETTRASCRSIPGFHITDALDQCSELLLHHGGHAAAAGFTVRNENVEELVARLTALADEQLTEEMLQPVQKVDLDIPLFELKPDILNELEKLQPTGIGNPQAYFVSRGLHAVRKQVLGSDSQHLKLTVTDGRITYDAIAFNMAEWSEALPHAFDLLYTFERNEWNGRVSMQLNVRDIRPAD